jgi:hypothetical protein
MTNKWIEHIKHYAKNNKTSCALSNPNCSKTFKEIKDKPINMKENIPKTTAGKAPKKNS